MFDQYLIDRRNERLAAIRRNQPAVADPYPAVTGHDANWAGQLDSPTLYRKEPWKWIQLVARVFSQRPEARNGGGGADGDGDGII